jgi:hypothetical protein
MKYPLLASLWQQSDAAAIKSMHIRQKWEISIRMTCSFGNAASVWSISGNNRALLWNLANGECEKQICVGNCECNVQLNSIPLRGKDGVLRTDLVETSYPTYQHAIQAMVLPTSKVNECKDILK